MVEFIPTGEQEFEEIIEEYEEEILIQEEALEPFIANFVDTPPAQGKPRCITPIFEWSLNIYMMCIYVQAFYGNYMHKYTYLRVLQVLVE